MPDNAVVTKDYKLSSREELRRYEEQIQAELHLIKEVIINQKLYFEIDHRPPLFPLWVENNSSSGSVSCGKTPFHSVERFSVC